MHEAQQNIYESSQKLDIIRHSLEVHRQQLPADSAVANEVKMEIESTQAVLSPVAYVGGSTFSALSEHTIAPSSAADPASNSRLAHQRPSVSFPRAASVTGKLEVSDLKPFCMASPFSFVRFA